MMFDLRSIEAAAERLAALLPEDARLLRDELKANIRPVLESLLNRLDLVTREEFEAQTRVLAHTRERLEQLEAQLQELESAGPP
ncbi:MAG: accessory factor UbiK family protein [Gammaproteobacteria bacterium]|jgi:BMFP domain-containing protein YqiC